MSGSVCLVKFQQTRLMNSEKVLKDEGNNGISARLGKFAWEGGEVLQSGEGYRGTSFIRNNPPKDPT